MSCSRTQHSEAHEARTHGPSFLSQALYHYDTDSLEKDIYTVFKRDIENKKLLAVSLPVQIWHICNPYISHSHQIMYIIKTNKQA